MADTGSPMVARLLSDLASASRSADAPVVVHMVTNGVRGDSRVIKSAQASQAQGFTTVILGITDDDEPEVLHVDGVTAVLVPFYPEADPSRFAPEWQRRARLITTFRKVRGLRSTLRRSSAPNSGAEPHHPAWATARPVYLNINVVFAEALDALGPAAIHVHDTAPLPAAIAHAFPNRLRGRRVGVMYDSHECVPELVKSFPGNPSYEAHLAIEKGYIREVDRVITVSRQIASLLQKTYGLRSRPGVVTNAPTGTRDITAPNLREVIGLAEDMPLAVYSGGLAAERGLGTVIRAMPSVPAVHLAVVCNTANRTVADLIKRARTLGVADRVHLAAYVPPSQVTQYLSSATVGLIPRKSGGHLDLSLPTKYREYLHAGLPLIVSNNKNMAREVRETGVGEVFHASNVEGLVEAINRVLEDPDRYRSAITPDLLALYSWEAQARTLQDCYGQLSSRPPRPGAAVDAAAILKDLVPSRFAEGSDAFTKIRDHRFAGVNLGIGRANPAGQSYHWAEALGREYGVTATSFAPVRATFAPSHRRAADDQANAKGMASELAHILSAHTHVLFDGFDRIFGTLLGDDIEAEIALLRRHGLRVGLIVNEGDLRGPERHRVEFSQAGFDRASSEWLELAGARSARNREIATTFGDPVFASSPDLRLELPDAAWLPVAVELDLWRSIPDLTERARPRVVHLPNQSSVLEPELDLITQILDELEERGVIDRVSRPDQVAFDGVPALVAGADIVVGQLRTGTYGTPAVEAMAAGRVVIGNLSGAVRECVPQEIPIIDACPTTLADVLTSLSHDRATLAARGAAGRAFAATWHSGKESARVLATFLAN